MYGDPDHSLSSQGPGFKYLWIVRKWLFFFKIEKNNFTEIRRSDLIRSSSPSFPLVRNNKWFKKQTSQPARYVPPLTQNMVTTTLSLSQTLKSATSGKEEFYRAEKNDVLIGGPTMVLETINTSCDNILSI